MLKPQEIQTIKEVIESIRLHRTVVINNRKHKARISQSTLQDFKEGMDISLSKLHDLIGETEILFRNYYKCPCGNEWQDEWDSMCNDHCPDCDQEIVPYKSKDIRGEE